MRERIVIVPADAIRSAGWQSHPEPEITTMTVLIVTHATAPDKEPLLAQIGKASDR